MPWERVVIEYGNEYVYMGDENDDRSSMAAGRFVDEPNARAWMQRKRDSAADYGYAVSDVSGDRFVATKIREDLTLKQREFFIRDITRSNS